MTFVYGDSTTFPHDVDYLALLDDGVDCAVQLASAQHAMDLAQKQIGQLEEEEQSQVQSLRALLEQTQMACQPCLETGSDRGRRTAEQMLAAARQVVDEAMTSVAGETSAKAAQARSALDSARQTTQRAVEHFLRHHTPPRSSLGLRLSPGQSQGEAQVSIGTAFHLQAVFAVAMPATHFWARPRRVGELAANVDVRLPQESGWLSKRVEVAPLRLDRFFVTDVQIRDGGGSLQLRKTAGAGAGYELRVHTQPEIVVSVCPISDDGTPDPERLLALEGPDTATVLGLWKQIGDSSADLYALRRAMTSARFGNQALEALESPLALTEALVRDMAPLVVEISRRSGAPGELVLRRNAGPRRREETYLTHAELLRKIFTLPPERRLVFSPLGLSSEELGALSQPPRAASGVVPAMPTDPPPRRSSQPGRSGQPPPLTELPLRASQRGPTVIVSEPDEAAPESTDSPGRATPPLTA